MVICNFAEVKLTKYSNCVPQCSVITKNKDITFIV